MNHEINLDDPTSIHQIQDILNEFQNSVLHVNGENNQYMVEFEFLLDDQTQQNIENLPNYFKSCKEIDEILGKSSYIKKLDPIIENKEIECIICTEQFEYKQYKRVLKCCNHTYHKKCIDKWLKKNSTCPYCRHDFLENKSESSLLPETNDVDEIN